MKISSFYLTFFLLSMLATNAQKTPTYVLPALPFDEEGTAKLLEQGTSTIRGNAYLKKKGKNNYVAKGGKIILFPVTPYFTEFVELKKKYNTGKKQATMTNNAFAYRVEGKYLDDQGGFEFSNLKPGRYYIITWVQFEKKKNLTIRTGTRTYYNQYSGNVVGEEAIYTNYTQSYNSEDEVAGFVEVKENGQVVNTVISN